MKRQRVFIGITLLLLAVIVALIVRYTGQPEKKSLKESLPVTVYSLSNGLKLVVVENHRIPAISHTLFVKAGGADDPPAKSGLAHYLEHLVFKGTKEVSEGEYDRRVAALGGENNAFTTNDYTAYYVNAPLEALEQVMALESDRMMNLLILDESAKTELDVIKEERRMRVENNPASQLAEQMDAVQFFMHPYRMPVIGWAHDIAGLTPEDARQFFAKYYVPNNMVLVVAGDVEPKDVRRLAMRYYGGMVKKPLAKRQWYGEPPAIAARKVALEDGRVKQRQWARNYRAPSLGEPMVAMPAPNDVAALELVAAWIGGGKTGVLYQELVERQKLAIDVSASYNGQMLGYGTFSIRAVPRDGVTDAELEKAMDAVLAATIAATPDAETLTRAKTLYRADITYAQDGLTTIASYIGALMMLGRDESYFYGLPAMVDAITAEDLQRVAQAVLVKKESVTGVLLPEAAPAYGQPALALPDDTAAVALP